MNHDETIFEQALGIDSGQAREEFLRGACAGNEAMFDRLQGLLQAHDRAGKFLEYNRPADGEPTFSVPPSGGPAQGPAEAGTPSPLTEQPGDRIGRYKLRQKIGEGGCGVVYMAEQEEPVRRRVVLKIIKLGMDTRQVIARFEAERQALALMDHPNIAKVFDAGVTERPLTPSLSPGGGEGARRAGEGAANPQPSTLNPQLSPGRPYCVMELVRGVKITEYCDEKKLTTHQRLELFTQVCRAVQHAHQKGIIHRDLKPSNILVSLNDGMAVPKVIDFGIAKATTGEPLTNKTVFTAFEQFIGTPAYMSPEQALVTSLDIDTRTDIYALGVLLYELLTGHTPFDPKELMQAGLEAMRRTICEREPERPSTRLSTLPGEALNTTAQRRGLDAPKLVSQLRGDLDWIVMKCLEKDRARRYETANGLATDIQRHLKNEPVVACPPSNLYRFQKLVRRNRLAFAAASAVSLTVLLGLAVSTWAFLKERQARERATTEAARNRQVSRLLQEVLNDLAPTIGLGRNRQTAQEILDKIFARIGDGLANQPEVEAALREAMAGTYDELGLYKRWQEIARDNLKFARARLGDAHPAVADALQQISGSLAMQAYSLDKAEAFGREALAMKRKIFGNENIAVAKSLNDLVHVLRRQGMWAKDIGKVGEAETLQREALAMQRKLVGDEHSDVAYSLYNLALVVRFDRPTEAESLYRQALALQTKLLGEKNRKVAEIRVALGGLLFREGKLEEAEMLFHEALATYQKLFSPDHPSITEALTWLARTLVQADKEAELQVVFSEASERGNFALFNDLAWSLATQADPKLRNGLRAVALAEKAVAMTNRSNASFLDTLAAACAETGDFSRAVSVQKEAIGLLTSEKEKEDYASRLKLYESRTPFHETQN